MARRLAGILLALLAAGPGAAAAHEPEPSRFTFWGEVRGIFERRCVGCHRPDGPAPMALVDYDDVTPWTSSIRMKILEGAMPPWLADETVGAFRGARSLTAEEIDILADWTLGGAPEGVPPVDAEDGAPAASASVPAPGLGLPDAVVGPSEPVVIPSDRSEGTVCRVVPTDGVPRRIRAIEARPEATRAVRSVTIWAGRRCDPSRRPLATWLPGAPPYEVPGGAAEALVPGEPLAIAVRVEKRWEDEGRVVADRTRIALWAAPPSAPAVEPVLLEPGRAMPVSGTILAFFVVPPAEPFGTVTVEAIGADGAREPLLRIERFDPAWNERLVLAEPRPLEPGTRLRALGAAVWVDRQEGQAHISH